MLAVHDVPASSRFYAELLRAEATHGGEEYEQLYSDGELVLQLHSIDVGHHHGPLANKDVAIGNGAVVWFEVSDFEEAAARAKSLRAEIERDVHMNPNAKQPEIWLRDPDGYLVVLAGTSEYRPRA